MSEVTSLPPRWQDRIQAIPSLDQGAMGRARLRLDNLTKPPGSLGMLEPVVIRLAGMAGRVVPALENPITLIFAADHGVSCEGVSAYEAEVTEQMAVNMAMGSAVSSVLARGVASHLEVVDVGIQSSVRHPRVRVRKVARGTRNITSGPAMTQDQLYAALEAGWMQAEESLGRGHDLLILGEMGIGNTTSGAAMAAVLLGSPIEAVVGIGTGVDGRGHSRKLASVASAIDINVPNPRDPVDVMRKLGGLEVAAMVGAMLFSATQRVPVLLDGMIVGVAALTAARLAPGVRDYLVAGHLSPEPAHRLILDALQLDPLLDLKLRLGEGSGALLALPLLTQSLKVMAETATFQDARVTNPHPPVTESPKPALAEPHVPVSHGFPESERAAVYKVLGARRDIRVFLPDEVGEAPLARILAAGHMAPSVGYMQPWNFILVRDHAIRQHLQEAVERERVVSSAHYRDAKRDYYLRLKVEGLMDAPLTLCVTNDPTRGGPHVLGRNTIPETDLMSTACAIENMWLAARAEGIAMGWVSMYRKEDVREILGIPGHVDPVALLSLGYTPHFPDVPVLERVGWGERLDLTTLVFFDRWADEADREGWHANLYTGRRPRQD